MSQVCKSLINDYITGALSLTDFEEGLSSVFGTLPSGHANAQTYIQTLFTADKIDSTSFTEISHLISKVNIESTLKGGTEVEIDTQFFQEDKTLHLTDLEDMTDMTEDGSSDKTVIVSAEGDHRQVTDISVATPVREDVSAITTKVVEKPHRSKKHENLGPGIYSQGAIRVNREVRPGWHGSCV